MNKNSNIIRGLIHYILIWLLISSFPVQACTRLAPISLELDPLLSDSLEIVYYVEKPSYRDWTSSDAITIKKYASLGFSHQSAAAYGDYAFFVTNGRSKILLYNLSTKSSLFTLGLKSVSGTTYHCNQSTFGVEKYEENDYFPLLYVSQRAKSDGRCFIEAYRIFPLYNEEVTEYESFYVELVQTIYLPKLTQENSLGNANCVIDVSSRTMYTYSRNNNTQDDNYGKCKISQFAIPDVHSNTVLLQDDDILSSFMIDASAVNMQGGCIKDGILYIGQGYSSAGYIYLNIVDLERQELVRRIDLQANKVNWEPEGCFFYDGSVMLAYTGAIYRIDK